MKTAYIITMHCPLNYGAVLQTYAFQTYLEKIGLQAKVIDYNPQYIVYDQSLMYVGDVRFRKNLITRWVYRIYKAPSKYIRRKKFKQFKEKELHLTKRFESYVEIEHEGLDADFFFCGSDQIWNVVSGAHKDPAYFLGFVADKNKKISYAASGNLPLCDEVINITFPMINRLGRISMREDSTLREIQPYIKKAIAHVCDPVFLLDETEWRVFYQKHAKFCKKEKYVLVYPMGNGLEATISVANQVATQMRIPLYMISASKRKDSRVDRQFDVDPYTFLSLIDNADFVVTNSFHGTSFSLILGKQFLTCVAEGSNQRITSLLNMAGLAERLVIGNSLQRCNKVNIKVAKEELSKYIERSKLYLSASIYE